MVKKISRKEVPSINFKKFRSVADNFYKGAEIAEEFEYYNASGVLLVHSAIAFSDAVTIKYSSKKCSGENHYEIIALLNEVIPKNAGNRNALNHLEKIIDHKNVVSYNGEIYSKKDITALKKHFERFKIWAEELIR
ncbi:MAG: hypothetical protein ABI638_08305 [Ignavibacteriota bacterium]